MAVFPFGPIAFSITVKREISRISIELNAGKCELLVLNIGDAAKAKELMDGFEAVAPGLKLVTPEQLSLLGSCVFDSNVEDEIGLFIPKLSLLCDRVSALSA
ncbi:hypothetical protein ACOME3_000905 [Neoechinorhynchus agilis]